MMVLKTFELISILLAAAVSGMFLGPWLALTRSFETFKPEIFLALVHRMSLNMAGFMTVLMPVTLISIVPVLFLSFREHGETFWLNLAGLALLLVALLVTMRIEVPIVQQIETWSVATLPRNWEQLRDRWKKFHVVRVVAGVAGLVLLLAGAIF